LNRIPEFSCISDTTFYASCPTCPNHYYDLTCTQYNTQGRLQSSVPQPNTTLLMLVSLITHMCL